MSLFQGSSPHIRMCLGCEEVFETHHSHKKYCTPDCQKSASSKNEWAKKKSNPYNRCLQLLAGAKNRAKTKKLEYDLSVEYLLELWEKYEGKCQISGISFNLDHPEKLGEPRFDAPSIDRIIPELGYIEGNVRLVIYQINMAIGPYGLQRLLDTIKEIS